jgi:hypothetical protein
MAKPAPSDGLRDLSLIRASGSTARVLNLALVYERFGESEAFKEQPLFRIPKLNRTLIIKHAVRQHERTLFYRVEPHTTKIVIPYSPTELELGGASMLVGEKMFDQLMSKAVGASVNEEDYAADLELIEILHELPSFDPFLMREQLKRAGREPARCFFEVSDADVAKMLAFVRAEIAPLVSLAFGAAGRRGEKLAERLAEKLMTDENAQVLAPMRETLRLSPAQFAEGVFAWKGYLYYKWMLAGFAEAHDQFAPRFAKCAIVTEDRRKRYEIEKLREDILRRIDLVMLRGGGLVADYDAAFEALVRGDANRFRAFLLDAPRTFMALGEAFGAVKHMYSFWGFRFPEQATPRLEADEALDLMQEFERMLNGIQLIRPESDREILL